MHGGQLCILWDDLAISLRVVKNLPLANWRCFPIHQVPVKDANEELLEGEPAQPGKGLAFPSKWKYPFFLQRVGGGGEVSQGGSVFICGFIYLFLKT